MRQELFERHFKYSEGVLSFYNKDKENITIIAITDAGRYSEGFKLFYTKNNTSEEVTETENELFKANNKIALLDGENILLKKENAFLKMQIMFKKNAEKGLQPGQFYTGVEDNGVKEVGWDIQPDESAEGEKPYSMYEAVTENFRQAMIKELANNSDKGDREGNKGWLSMNKKQLLSELYYHVGKLQAAMQEQNLELIKEHCADVANGALMAHDCYSPLAEIPFQSHLPANQPQDNNQKDKL